MTETTDIKALREASLKATKGRWLAFTDDRSKTYAIHTPNDKRCEDVIKWAGFDCQKNAKANAEFIALANPATIIALLDQLEAERQQREAAEAVALAMRDDMRVAREELAALRGEQEPVAWLNEAYLRRGVVDGEAGKEDAGPGYIPVYRERQPKPVVVLPKTLWYEHDDLPREIPVLEKKKVIKILKSAGIVIKDGE